MDYSSPTLPTVATRLPNLKSTESCRGFTIHANRVVIFESHLELMVVWILAAMPGVVTIIDQPAALPYVDDAGIHCHHTFDFLVVMSDGRRLLIAVKPKKKARKVKAVARAIAAQLAPGIADEVHVITDAHFTRTDRHNAGLIAQCSRFPVVKHDELVDRITARMAGAVTIRDIVSTSGLGGAGFRAVIRLIGRGLLHPISPTRGRITQHSYVVRRSASL